MEWKCWSRLLIFIFFLTYLNPSGICQVQTVFKSDSIACDTFPSPRNFSGVTFDNAIHLWWEVPELIGSYHPQNLVAYKIFKDGLLKDSIIFESDTTHYFEYFSSTYPTYHHYWVTSVYDMSFCGLPGEFAESITTDTLTFWPYYGFILPFVEDWNTGSFDPYLWNADESWSVDGTFGHPYPCATYSNLPDSAYRQSLISYWIDCKDHPGTVDPYIDGDIYLEFDLKLNHLPVSGEDYLNIEITDSMGWQIIEQFSTEQGSFGWTNYKMNITELAKGKYLRLAFVAHGEDGSNTLDWYIDNIIVSRVCNPPVDLHWVVFDEIMAWSPPEPHTSDKVSSKMEFQGYNIYANSTFLATTTDTIYALGIPLGYGPYYVTAIYEDCEPTSNYIYGPQDIEEISDDKEIKIFPNPCNEQLNINSAHEVKNIQITDARGEIVFMKKCNRKNVIINTSSYPEGIYILKTQNSKSISSRKFIIQH